MVVPIYLKEINHSAPQKLGHRIRPVGAQWPIGLNVVIDIQVKDKKWFEKSVGVTLV